MITKGQACPSALARWFTSRPISGLLILLLTLILSCSEAPPPPMDGVDTIFASYTTEGSPGASVMVIQSGEIVHSAGYGLADIASGVPLTPDTPVRLASLSKAFMTMGAMILAERDSLDYDDPITNWLPELTRFPGVTVRHLMNHTSGLPGYYGQVESRRPQLDDDPLVTNAEAATVYQDWGAFDFQPGEQYAYNNPAYEMLALIIERVSGQTTRDFLQENVFTPLAMETAEVRDRRDYRVPNSAVGYRKGLLGSWKENDDHFLNGLVGAGGVYASINDLYQWDQALYGDGIVSAETLAEAFEPTTLNDGTISDYGFGWGVGERNGQAYIGHSGSWVGFRTCIHRYPEVLLSVIVLSNASAPACELGDEVAGIYLTSE